MFFSNVLKTYESTEWLWRVFKSSDLSEFASLASFNDFGKSKNHLRWSCDVWVHSHEVTTVSTVRQAFIKSYYNNFNTWNLKHAHARAIMSLWHRGTPSRVPLGAAALPRSEPGPPRTIASEAWHITTKSRVTHILLSYATVWQEWFGKTDSLPPLSLISAGVGACAWHSDWANVKNANTQAASDCQLSQINRVMSGCLGLRRSGT